MSKNIDNRNAIVTGISVSSTDSVPEGVTNLYYTDARVNAQISANPNYKNAESLFLVPISGPTLFGGQMMISDGAIWQVTNNMNLNNSDLIVSSGSYAFPNAYHARIGPRAIVKNAGNVKYGELDIATIGSSGYVELFITAEDIVSFAMYQNCDKFFYKNNAGIVTVTIISGFHSSEYNYSIAGTKIELFLNSTNTANVTATVTMQTAQGALPIVTIS